MDGAKGRFCDFGGGLAEVDYPAYLSKHDVVYESPAATPTDGMPLGNGESGALFWMPENGPRWELGKCDLWDDGPERPFGAWGEEDEEIATALRSAGTLRIDAELPVFDWMYLDKFSARLELYSARATLDAATPFSSVSVETWAGADPSCLVVNYRDSLAEPVPRRIMLERWGSRVFSHWYRTIVREPRRGLSGTTSGAEDGHIWIVQQTRSHTFAVAATIDGIDALAKIEHGRRGTFVTGPVSDAEFRLYVSVVSSEDAPDPLAAARRNVETARGEGADRLRERHRKWWSAYWDRSFVAVPDDYIENLWYLNHYVMGSGSRGKYPPHFINGIWNPNRDLRAWNHLYHWNQEELNWPVFTAGHPELSHGYLRMRSAALPRAKASARRLLVKSWAPPRWKEIAMAQEEVGAWYSDVFERRGWQDEGPPIFTPGLQIALDMWRYWRHTGDETFLREIAWPFMREACRFYLTLLERDEEGTYHLPASHPYEHASGYMVRDCLTDMAHLRTAFPATAAIAERMNDAEFAAALREVAANLPDVELIPLPSHYLKDSARGRVFARGFFEGCTPPFDRMLCVGRRAEDGKPVYFRCDRDGVGGDSLFPGSDESLVWPSGAVGLKDRGSELFRAAEATAMANRESYAMGWSVHTIVFARLGMREHLHAALAKHVEMYQHFPSGLWNYQESQSGSAYDGATVFEIDDVHDGSDRFPFLRQPHTHFGFEPGAVLQTTVNEMLLQSYDGSIRVCPAVPDSWNGAFSLWAEGGFQVTAVFRKGRASGMDVLSARGEECRIVPNPDGDAPTGWSVVDAATGSELPARCEGDAFVFPTTAGMHYRIVSSDGAMREALSGVPNAHAKRRGARWIGIPRRW